MQRLVKIGRGRGQVPRRSTRRWTEAEAALADGDYRARPSAIYRPVLEARDATTPQAVAGLVRCSIAAGDLAGAQEMLAQRAAGACRRSGHQRRRAAGSSSPRRGQKAGGPVARSLQARIAANPKDFEARYDLAVAQSPPATARRRSTSCWRSSSANRAWNEEAARKQLLKFFEAMGPTDPADPGRPGGSLSSLLFFVTRRSHPLGRRAESVQSRPARARMHDLPRTHAGLSADRRAAAARRPAAAQHLRAALSGDDAGTRWRSPTALIGMVQPSERGSDRQPIPIPAGVYAASAAPAASSRSPRPTTAATSSR